ncbi:MAG: zf-TFIIB domain-containing protein [Myxococcales bacterium]|nr:zf-TFIIB domain-containing protein [Myxococcales bacterium]
MIYRDEREQCPRCSTELIDARAARGCSTCGGLWIGVGDVQEMVQQMQTPQRPMELTFEIDQRTALACPSCKDPMRTLNLYGVPIDSCVKHGIWFDAKEFATVLWMSAKRTA